MVKQWTTQDWFQLKFSWKYILWVCSISLLGSRLGLGLGGDACNRIFIRGVTWGVFIFLVIIGICHHDRTLTCEMVEEVPLRSSRLKAHWSTEGYFCRFKFQGSSGHCCSIQVGLPDFYVHVLNPAPPGKDPSTLSVLTSTLKRWSWFGFNRNWPGDTLLAVGPAGQRVSVDENFKTATMYKKAKKYFVLSQKVMVLWRNYGTWKVQIRQVWTQLFSPQMERDSMSRTHLSGPLKNGKHFYFFFVQ